MTATLNADDIALIRTEIDNALLEIKGDGWVPEPSNGENQALSNIFSQVITTKLQEDQNAVSIRGETVTTESLVTIQEAIETLQSDVAAILSTIGSGSVAGPGSVPRSITISAEGNPIVGAGVWITSDVEGTDIVGGTVYTNDSGVATLMVTPGTTYYAWCNSSEAEFTNPTKWEA